MLTCYLFLLKFVLPTDSAKQIGLLLEQFHADHLAAPVKQSKHLIVDKKSWSNLYLTWCFPPLEI